MNIVCRRSGLALCHRLLEDTGVAMLPGRVFGRPADELTARIAYVDFDGAGALAGIEEYPRDKDPNGGFLKAHCSNVIEGIDRLCGWITGT